MLSDRKWTKWALTTYLTREELEEQLQMVFARIFRPGPVSLMARMVKEIVETRWALRELLDGDGEALAKIMSERDL